MKNQEHELSFHEAFYDIKSYLFIEGGVVSILVKNKSHCDGLHCHFHFLLTKKHLILILAHV